MEGTVNKMKQKTRVFCQIDVQEFHLFTRYGRDILRVLIRSRMQFFIFYVKNGYHLLDSHIQGGKVQ
jgi:hypothetical protein